LVKKIQVFQTRIMYTIFSNVHEVFWCLKQTLILNGYNLHGKILIFCLIFILKFENLVFFLFFFSHFGFQFSTKGVLLWCLIGVHVDKTIVQICFCLGIDIYDFFYTWSMKKNVKMQIQATRCQHFGSN
jgi:hypothetical protein